MKRYATTIVLSSLILFAGCHTNGCEPKREHREVGRIYSDSQGNRYTSSHEDSDLVFWMLFTDSGTSEWRPISSLPANLRSTSSFVREVNGEPTNEEEEEVAAEEDVVGEEEGSEATSGESSEPAGSSESSGSSDSGGSDGGGGDGD